MFGSTILQFDQNKLDQIVQAVDRQVYKDAPYVRILQRLAPTDTRTVVCDQFSEKLARELWPGVVVEDEPTYGRAILWEVDANEDGMMRTYSWIKKSVDAGQYDELNWLSWNVRRIMLAMKEAAEAVGITRLNDICMAGLQRVESGQQLDAAQAVQS